MSRDMHRRNFFDRDRRERDWGRNDYRSRVPLPPRHRSRSPERRRERDRDRGDFKRQSRSPRRGEKDALDDNILSEISKLPEPSELWDGNNHPPEGSYPPAAPPPAGYPVEGFNSNFPPSYSRVGVYDEFAPPPPDTSGWNQMSLPPPPIPQMSQQHSFPTNVEDQIKKEAAIESEMRHQKAALSKQREDYMKKANILKKELETLKDQRNELRGDPKRSPSPDTKRFLKENTKLQLEIQNKLKTITNVVDMLNGIIGEGAQHIDAARKTDESPERSSAKRRSRSEDENKKFNYVYYDPEMHWCRVCNEFPPTAKDYLNHLHSASHNKMAAAHMEAPWHSITGVNEGFPSFPSAPNKRTPIRGLQFFVPSTAWYCKLCDVFIGDLHCASAHLKSIQHSNNYINFVEQNPHWETDWMSDRQKSFEKARIANKNKPVEKPASYAAHTITFDKDGFHTTKEKDTPQPQDPKRKKEKKKKNKRSKKSSSSSSSSSSSDSETTKRKSKTTKRANEAAALHEWMVAMQRQHRTKRDSRSKEKETRRSPERAPSENKRRRSRSAQRRRQRTSPSKKPEIRKMPFIGKMPIYKNQSKKTEEEKKKDEETKKKQGDDEASKRRQQEIDAEIQKKVAEFKEKIAKAQLDRQPEQVPPIMMHIPPPMPLCAPAPPAPPALAQDFQDALDIIFPPEVKKQAAEMVNNPDFIASMQQGLQPQFPGMPGAGLLPNPFLPPGVMTQMPLMGFDLNSQLNPQLFQTRPQLYSLNNPAQNNKNKNRNKNQYQNKGNKQTKPKVEPTPNGNKPEPKNKEELDDLAMLGIDASDVGAM